MKINKHTLAASLLVSSTALLGQAFAESHSKVDHTKSMAQTTTQNSSKNSFGSSVEYGTRRGTTSAYQVRAGELIGETVERPNGDNLGEIDDLIYSETDKSIMVIISVGGFLGIGEKLVAVPYKELRVSADRDDIYLDTTEEALKAKPEFKYNDDEMSGQAIRNKRERMARNAQIMSYDNSVEYGKYRGEKSAYHVRASELIGETVEQRNGDNIGEIDDLVYAGANNKLMAIISVGGFLGIGEKLVAVPYDELRVSSDGDDVYLNSSEKALKAKAEFKYNKGEASGRELRMNRDKVASKVRKSKYADSVEYGKYRNAKSLYQIRASEIIGETVETSNGDNIGEIDDVIYSRTDKKLMAIISVGGFLGMGEKLVAVPYNKLRISADGDDVYLDSTKEKLKAMTSFKYSDK